MIVNRYLFRETAKPLAVTLVVTLTALVMERSLRLVEIVSNQSGSPDMVFSLAFFLIPYYAGLALPAAFFISLFSTIARLDADNEMFALSSVGMSLARIMQPLILGGAVLAFISIVLFGFVQPYSRYLYREIKHIVAYTGWDARLSPGVFYSPDDTLTVHTEQVDATGRRLIGIFIVDRRASSEAIITAEKGFLRTNLSKTRLQLVLQNGTQSIFFPESDRTETVSFSELAVARDFSVLAPPFRVRGEDDRELTLFELREVAADPTQPDQTRHTASAEFHARIVRAISLPLLPLLAVSMAVASRRSGRGAGMVVGGVTLVLFHHMLQLGEGFVNNGAVSAFVGLWVPFLLFAGFCIWAFYRTNSGRGQTPFAALFEFLERTSGRLARLAGRRNERPA